LATWDPTRLAFVPAAQSGLARLRRLKPLAPFPLSSFLSSSTFDCPHRPRRCRLLLVSLFFIIWPIRIPFIPLGSITLLRLHLVDIQIHDSISTFALSTDPIFFESSLSRFRLSYSSFPARYSEAFIPPHFHTFDSSELLSIRYFCRISTAHSHLRNTYSFHHSLVLSAQRKYNLTRSATIGLGTCWSTHRENS
jgi:hypothetical protein